TEMGQGLHTKMRAVAAHELGIPKERIRVMATRTDKVPNTSPTAASSGSDLNGAAVREACRELRRRLAPVSELLPEAERDDWGKLIARAYLERVPLSATGFYATPGIGMDWNTGQGTPFYYFACGAAVCEVEVDGFTGDYRLRRVDILHDVGDSLAPGIDRGQIEGGFIQGVGWLTVEELKWNEKGVLLTHSPDTYKIPAIGDAPWDFRVNLLREATQAGTVGGSKAVGEPPLMLAIAAREAIRDAVAAFGTGGRIELASPATGEAIWHAVRRVRTQT
ncbi:MAG: molybdopterin-dependent oxidoreductase, partial [Verrucomicrobia bacterium]|nr:molybdopterin-dependent oxidoreductase [Verrucomicrobiota bacterium]